MSKKKKNKSHNSMSKKTSIGKAKDVFTSSLRFFLAYPISIIPLLLCWTVYASVILYMQYRFDWDYYSIQIAFFTVFLCYILFSIVYGIACLVLLEIVQQIETEEKTNLGRAVKDVIMHDAWKAGPILLVWAVVWFLLAVLEALFSKKKEKLGSTKLTARSAVGTLLGDGSSFSLSGVFFHALSKGIRMIVFLILPAIAWEDLGPVNAFRKGLYILGEVKKEFMVAYGMSGIFALTVMAVPGVIYYVDQKLTLNLPEPFWAAILIYMAFASSFSLMIEQLYVAKLYSRYMNGRKALRG